MKCALATLVSSSLLLSIAPAVASADDAHLPAGYDGFDVGLGLWLRRPSGRGESTGSAPSGASWRIPTARLAPIMETMIDGQIRFRYPKPFYFGFDVAAGWARANALAGTYDDYGVPTAFATDGHGMALIFDAVAGATVLESSIVDLRAEVAVGLDVWSVDLSTPTGCSDADGNDTPCSLTHFGLIAEPRLAADVWLTRWMSVGTWIGYDAWPFGGASFGAAFVFSSRPSRG